MRIVSDIYKFNEEAGLLGKGMDSFLETAYIIEEALEGFEEVFNNPEDVNAHKATARMVALSFLNQIRQGMEQRNLKMPSEVAEFDKAIDGVWFNIGKLAKMRLSVDQIERGFDVVATCNMAKIGGPKDELGKQLKPIDWTGPEVKLQKILDERPAIKEQNEH